LYYKIIILNDRIKKHKSKGLDKMRAIFLYIFLINSIINIQVIAQSEQIELFVASWNVENLFDTLDDTTKVDEEFLPNAEREWDYPKMERKVMNLAKVLKTMNDGKAPDVFGLQEVENIVVCKYIAYEFDTRDYIVCHRQSPDERGIDNALIYDRNILDIVSINAIPVVLPDESKTRDILYVRLSYKATGDTIHFFVNHWPSRRGGQLESEPNRIAAANMLKLETEKILSHNPKAEIIIMGDFNDEPADKSISEVLGAVQMADSCSESNKEAFTNLAYNSFINGDGTYLFRNDWNMLDQMIISPALYDNEAFSYEKGSFHIVKPEFMITAEGKYKGSPKPTYGGRAYIGGYSDHFPVAAKFICLSKK